MAAATSSEQQSLFQALKPPCVALLQHSRLLPKNIPLALTHLRSILATLSSTQLLNASLASYIFFPISEILRRNASHEIPDSIMETIMLLVSALAEFWWWSGELVLWDQLLVLTSGVLVIPASSDPTKTHVRDDETKHATVKCLLALLSPRTGMQNGVDARERLEDLQSRSQSDAMIPVFGRILDVLLDLSLSDHRELQKDTLTLLTIIIQTYLHDDLAPTVLPGVASTSAKVALGLQSSGSWTSGQVVESAVAILESIIEKAIGDDVCLQEGLVVEPISVEALFEPTDYVEPAQKPIPSKPTPRTASWLKASTAQIHMVLNSLTPLVQHPHPKALVSLCSLANSVILKTRLTLPQSHPMMLTFLLLISTNASVLASEKAHEALLNLLNQRQASNAALVAILKTLCYDVLISLPRAITMRNDAKVEQFARQISAVCQLAIDSNLSSNPFSHLLGPTGGIEKWGWGLLSIIDLEFDKVQWTNAFPGSLLTDSSRTFEPFPSVRVKQLASPSSLTSFENMFRKLGKAAGDSTVYAAEWFLGVGLSGQANALWCAALLLEGQGNISLSMPHESSPQPSAALDRMTRSLVRSIADSWDDVENRIGGAYPPSPGEENMIVEHVRGLIPLQVKLDDFSKQSDNNKSVETSMALHRIFSLRLITITSAILGPRFSRSFLHSLYPVLHGIVSDNSIVSVTGTAALQRIAYHTAYANAGNCLLANFDYILDCVAQRLTRLKLEPDALKVLSLLVKLVGSDIVLRAGDVIEECFDRLDDFHGYSVFAEGLVSVLAQVVEAIHTSADEEITRRSVAVPRRTVFATFETIQQWIRTRSKPPTSSAGHSVSDIQDQVPVETVRPNPAAVDDSQAKEENIATSLVSQLLRRSIPFLTHGSPYIRAKILGLMASSTGLLPDASLLPSVHKSWPYVLNRLDDKEIYVVAAAAAYVQALCRFAGDFTGQRVWKDIWPRYKKIVGEFTVLANKPFRHSGDMHSNSDSTYSWTHRLLAAILHTTLASVESTSVPHDTVWDITVTLRPLLASSFHPSLQALAIKVYKVLYSISPDTIWLVLQSSIAENGDSEQGFQVMQFLRVPWDIRSNVSLILSDA